MASSEVERVGRTATAGLPPDLPPLQELVWRRLRRRGVTPPGPSGFNEGSSSHNPGSPTGPGSDLAPTVADLSQSRSSQRGSNHLSYMVDQVWSLTHFYSLTSIFSRSTVKETLYFIGLFSRYRDICFNAIANHASLPVKGFKENLTLVPGVQRHPGLAHKSFALR